VYGEPQLENKFKTWELLAGLHNQDTEHLPWLCADDFNEIIFHHEKEGGNPRPQVYIDRFKNALEVCELDDLGFVGDVFTWRNKQTKSSSHIRERIDRAVANAEWRMMFPFVQVRNGDPYHSDHRPIVVETEKLQRRGRGGSGNSFHFEASWCKEVIEEAWGSGVDDDRRLGERIRGVAASLKEWSMNVLGDLEKRLKKAKKS
jgi:hypothetical protein